MSISINFIEIRDKDQIHSTHMFSQSPSLSLFSQLFQNTNNPRFVHNNTILQDPLNPEIFTQNPLPVYVVSSKIVYPMPIPEMKIPVEVVEEEKIIVSGEDPKVKEKIGKDLYDMKNENDVIELFKQLGLGKDELREFCKVALNDRKDLDENEKYNDVIESPFVAKLLNDREMLAKMAKD